MKEPVYVTEIVKTESSFPLRHVALPIEPAPTSFDGYTKWQAKNSWKIEYSVDRSNLQEAKELAARLFEIKSGDEEDKIIKRLLELKAKPWKEKTDLEKWAHMALQKPEDWGPASWAKKAELKSLITELCFGRVLESMCGFRTCVGDSPKIKEVVALDFCGEALKRYDRPERKRILYNLEDIIKGDKMEFFEDKTFHTVTASFGIDYLTDPVPVHKEFYRILSDDGQLLVVDGPGQGYVDIKKRKFNPQVCAKFMEAAGFSATVQPLPTIKLDFEPQGYFLVRGEKLR